MSSEHDQLEAEIAFLRWNDIYNIEKPFQIFINLPSDAEDKRSTNLMWEKRSKLVRDLRNLKPFNIDESGFTFLRQPSRLTDFTNKENIITTYLPEVEQIIRAQIKGVERLFIFDWRLRRSDPVKEDAVVDLNNSMNWLLPAEHAHVDQSPVAVLNRIRLQFPDEAETLLQGRVRIINVWRPLEKVRDWPLALCDGRTVDHSDLVECDHIRRRYIGSTMYLLESPRHRWYYLSNQTPDEVIIFKNFDSSEDVEAHYSPHAAFKQRIENIEVGGRSSIEVRALVFGPQGDQTKSL
ncbi:hypothetical protein F5B20DRAFT_585740 [Whalleya microplaca]|nr:hypothetical protein F5B20DRAFT_585740 [Whalleya microplaca]